MDKLRTRITEERERFEVYEFDPKVSWNEVEKELAGTSAKQRKLWGGYAWKAAAVLAVVSGLAFVLYFGMGQGAKSSSEMSIELAEIEVFYANKINEKMLLISKELQGDEVYQQEMNMLDQAYLELRKDFKESTDNEEVINAMVQNHKIRLEILEGMLNKIKETKNEGNRHINL